MKSRGAAHQRREDAASAQDVAEGAGGGSGPTGGGWRFSGGKRATRGTPQGGVVSPLLANIYMNRYLRSFRLYGLDRRYGARLVNYADDFVVLCRHGAAEVLAQTRRWLRQMGLTLNEQKTRRVRRAARGVRLPGLHLRADATHRKDGHGTWVPRLPGRRCRGSRGASGRSSDRATRRRGTRWWRAQPRAARVGGYFCYGTRCTAYRAVDRYVVRTGPALSAPAAQGPLARDAALLRATCVFGELGVLRLQASSLGPPAHASGVRPVREPDAGKPHVRFDEEGRETSDGPLGEWTPDPKGRKQWGAAGPVHDRARPSLYRSSRASPTAS